jgi:hypothetical protein
VLPVDNEFSERTTHGITLTWHGQELAEPISGVPWLARWSCCFSGCVAFRHDLLARLTSKQLCGFQSTDRPAAALSPSTQTLPKRKLPVFASFAHD